METVYLFIIIFLCVLAVFDLMVGVSNDAVNFISSAVGARAAKFRTIVAVASVGVFVGAAMSNGMMDVARHGIFTPQYFSFYEVMCIFLAVVVTDVILLDVFNTLGMPTSTTVSMVFELLGGAFVVALIKTTSPLPSPQGEGELMSPLTLGDLLNTDKALQVILAIFMSVAIAFLCGALVMWVTRLVFTFTYGERKAHASSKERAGVRMVMFGALCATAIVWFLLINGLKGSSLMTDELRAWIAGNTWSILGCCLAAMTAVMAVLSLLRVNILRVVVLMGTFALAMAFAGNDLVNFVGVTLTGLDAYQDFCANGQGNPHTFLMTSLMQSAQTPIYFLLLAGGVMVLSLIFSKKARNVVKTSVDLSSKDEGDEMFGSSAVARTLVRTSTRCATAVCQLVPRRVGRWVDSRFQQPAEVHDGAAFDMVRASVNLVLAGLLVALGTSMKLPLSTTYVTFMVAMGASLADRAWSRESAVFRITGVLSVIGGWFITGGAAFFLCFLVTAALYYGSFAAMLLAVVTAIALLIRSNLHYKAKERHDDQYRQMMRETDRRKVWLLLCDHIREGNAGHLRYAMHAYNQLVTGFLDEQYRPIKQSMGSIDDQRQRLKRQRRREVMVMRRLDPLTMIQRNTWYFLGINACGQMLYGIKRMGEPIREHVGNSFPSLPECYREHVERGRDKVLALFQRAHRMLLLGDLTDGEQLRAECSALQHELSAQRKAVLDTLQHGSHNLNTMLLLVHLIQESQELVGSLRHMIRGMSRFASEE